MGVRLKDLDTVKAANEGAKLLFTHPITGEKLDCWMMVAGRDSDVYQKGLRSISNRRIQQVNRNPASISTTVTAEKQKEEEYELVSKAVLDWGGFLDEDDNEMPFSQENVLAVLREFPWVFEQVDAFIANRANFLV